jgi:hypothetical protein
MGKEEWYVGGDLKKSKGSWVLWLTSIIPATWEAEIRKITVQGQKRQKVSGIPSQQQQQNWYGSTSL